MPDMIESSCSLCGYVQKVNSKFAGRQWPCASCGEEYNVALRPEEPADPAAADPFQTAALDEILVGGPSIFDEPGRVETENGAQPLPKAEESAPNKAEILRLFMQLD